MNLKRIHSGCRNWKTQVGILGLIALWSGTAASGLPGNPKDPPLPPTSMGEMFGDSSTVTIQRVLVDEDCGAGGVPEGSLRLQDGDNAREGRVELCIDFPFDPPGPVWSRVCDDYWSEEDAIVVCRQLGLTAANGVTVNAQSFHSSHFGAGTAPYSLNNFLCSGNEQSLLGCITLFGRNIGFDARHCTDNDAAGVRCLTTSGDATLQDLYLQEGATADPITIKPGPQDNPYTGFVSGLFQYFTEPEVPSTISDITIYATKTDAGATVEYYDSSSNLLGSGPSLAVRNLAIGWTQINVQVTADDGTVQDYDVFIDRR